MHSDLDPQIEAAIRELTYARFEFMLSLFENPKLASGLRHIENALQALNAVADAGGASSRCAERQRQPAQ